MTTSREEQVFGLRPLGREWCFLSFVVMPAVLVFIDYLFGLNALPAPSSDCVSSPDSTRHWNIGIQYATFLLIGWWGGQSQVSFHVAVSSLGLRFGGHGVLPWAHVTRAKLYGTGYFARVAIYTGRIMGTRILRYGRLADAAGLHQVVAAHAGHDHPIVEALSSARARAVD